MLRRGIWILTLLLLPSLSVLADPFEGQEVGGELHEWYLGFGPVALGNLNATGVGIGFEGARAWDVGIASVKLFGIFALRGSSYFGQFGLGINKFLSDGEYAPYVTADLGYGFAKVDEGSVFAGESTSGFVLGGGAGVQLFRSATVNVDVGLRAALLLSSTSLGQPTLLFFRVGLFF